MLKTIFYASKTDKIGYFGTKMPFITICEWDKYNAIHNWLVNNVQEGNDTKELYPITRDVIEALIYQCSICLEKVEYYYSLPKVRDVKDILGEAKVLTFFLQQEMPTTKNIHFGSYAYNDRYFSYLLDTKETLEAMLEDEELKDMNFYYISYW